MPVIFNRILITLSVCEILVTDKESPFSNAGVDGGNVYGVKL